jgi:hypothetical protein
MGRVAGGWPAPLDIDDHAGDLGHAGLSDGLLLQ